MPTDAIRRRRALAEASDDADERPRRRRRNDRDRDSALPITMMSIEVQYFGDLTRRERRGLLEDVLRRIDLKLPLLLRASDVSYREGKGRVCVLLPDTSPVDAEVVVERVRRSLEFELLPTNATVTIKLGTAGDSLSRI